MSTNLDRHMHPVLACAETIGTALKETADVQVTFMEPAEKRAAMLALTRLEAQLSALKLRVMAVSDDVALAEGARDVAALITQHTRGDFGANRRDLALADGTGPAVGHGIDGAGSRRSQRRPSAGDHACAGGAAHGQGRRRGAR